MLRVEEGEENQSLSFESSKPKIILTQNFLWLWKDFCVLMIARVSCLYHRHVLLFTFI